MNEQMLSVKALASELVNRRPLGHRLDVDFAGCSIRVVTNSDRLADRLRDYFEPFVAPAVSPAITVMAIDGAPPLIDAVFTAHLRGEGKAVKEEFVNGCDGRIVRKVRTEMVFFMSGAHQLAVGDCLANDNQVISFVNSRFMDWRLQRGGLLLHAAGVASREYGIGLAGTSGKGKSTLALHLMDRGLDFVSNDRLIVESGDRGITMAGLAKWPRVNPGTLLTVPGLHAMLSPDRHRELAAMPAEQLWNLEEKHDVLMGKYYGPDRHKLHAPLSAIVVLNWRHGGGKTLVEPVDLDERRDLLIALMKAPGLFCEAKVPSAEDYIQVLRACPAYEVGGGVDFAAAVDQLLPLLLRSP